MADLSKGNTFVALDTVDHVKLNNLVDAATVLDAFISGKSSVATPDPADYLVFSQTSTSTLKKTPYQTKVTSVAMTVPAPFVVGGTPVTAAGTLAVTVPNQSGNVFYCSPVLGAAGQPLFRHIVAQDTVNAPSAIPALQIDWRLNNNHFKVIAGNSTFTFASAMEGQQINVVLQSGGAFTVAWPTVKWRGGTVPVMTATSGRFDIFHFYLQGGIYFGWAEQNFF